MELNHEFLESTETGTKGEKTSILENHTADGWNRFEVTGAVSDYLSYAANVKHTPEKNGRP